MIEIPVWFLQWALGIVASGFLGLIAVIGFFLRRLIQQQDQHAARLADHGERLKVLEAAGRLEPRRVS